MGGSSTENQKVPNSECGLFFEIREGGASKFSDFTQIQMSNKEP